MIRILYKRAVVRVSWKLAVAELFKGVAQFPSTLIHISSPIWVKFGTINLYAILFRNFKFLENRREKVCLTWRRELKLVCVFYILHSICLKMSTKMYGCGYEFLKICGSNTLLRGIQEFLSVTATFITRFGRKFCVRSLQVILSSIHMFRANLPAEGRNTLFTPIKLRLRLHRDTEMIL